MRFLLLFLCIPVCAEVYPKTEVPHKYHTRLVELCAQYDVPPYYAARLIQWESGWNPACVHKNKNGTTDYGLGGLNSKALSDFYRWHNDGKPFDPMNWEDNLRVCIKHLRFLYNITGSWWSTFVAYNMGVQGWKDMCDGKRPLPRGTRLELDYIFK